MQFITSAGRFCVSKVEIFHNDSFLIDRTSVSTKPIFFQQNSDLLEQEQIFHGNMLNVASENSTNLWKYDMWYTWIPNWYKI